MRSVSALGGSTGFPLWVGDGTPGEHMTWIVLGAVAVFVPWAVFQLDPRSLGEKVTAEGVALADEGVVMHRVTLPLTPLRTEPCSRVPCEQRISLELVD